MRIGTIAWTGVCVLTATSLLAGCRGGGSSAKTTITTATTTGASGLIQGVRVLATVDVHETEYRLAPSTIGFERIGYFGLRAINDGTVPHALAVSGPGVDARTPTIAPGKSATIAVFFRKPGVYKLYCPIGNHAQRGMIGRIRLR